MCASDDIFHDLRSTVSNLQAKYITKMLGKWHIFTPAGVAMGEQSLLDHVKRRVPPLVHRSFGVVGLSSFFEPQRAVTLQVRSLHAGLKFRQRVNQTLECCQLLIECVALAPRYLRPVIASAISAARVNAK